MSAMDTDSASPKGAGAEAGKPPARTESLPDAGDSVGAGAFATVPDDSKPVFYDHPLGAPCIHLVVER